MKSPPETDHQRLKIYIKDSGSSSGTFVNHIRLTAANTESAKPHEIVDGDLIQLGVDYKGGLEPMYRAVRMRLEVNRKWQEASSNTYSLSAFQQLRNQIAQQSSNNNGEELQECCICLYCIAPFQALFIAPCSHVYHYRCLRPLLMQNYPGFSCPLCRAYSNLEASVAVEENEVMEMLGMANNSEESSSSHHQREKTVFAEDEVRNFTLIQNLTIILSNNNK
jgi:pSer/pThr/pTyr-binding forkhead associated (FHA) protein